ncbi:MAG: flagellar basal body L-ring protein FlgH [Hydrogenophilaceae bacterium]|nr:flagellar basal body L-ring protein FlgH [Hydrogenophilaceae bacterium]
MKMKPGIRYTLVAAAALLAGCNTVPSTNIKQPFTAPPLPKSTAIESNGSIFQPGRGMALFEDRRARHVGDTLTVNLVEKTAATRKSETTEDRSASADINVPAPRVFNKTPQVLGIGTTSWNPSSETNQAFKDNDTNSNSFTGAITVTVIEVLPNGNLRVSGEKQLSINNDTDYIRLTGVVNPAYLTASNSINSTQLADAQVESKNSQGLDQAQMVSMFARFFLTLVPF